MAKRNGSLEALSRVYQHERDEAQLLYSEALATMTRIEQILSTAETLVSDAEAGLLELLEPGCVVRVDRLEIGQRHLAHCRRELIERRAEWSSHQAKTESTRLELVGRQSRLKSLERLKDKRDRADSEDDLRVLQRELDRRASELAPALRAAHSPPESSAVMVS